MHDPKRRARILRTLLAVLAVAAMVFVTACGGGDDSSSSSGSSNASSSTGGKKQVRAALIGVAPVTSGDWDPAGYKAFQAMCQHISAKCTNQESVSYDDAAQVLRRLAQSNDLIIAHSSGYEAAVLEVAPQFPKTHFVVWSDLSTTKGLKNVTGYAANWNELGYLMGTIGEAASPTHKFGHVNSEPIPAFARWAGGAKQAATDQGSASDYLSAYIGTFTDQSKAKQAALAMMDKGAGVIFASADSAGLGAVDAAKEKGKLVIMPYIDQSKIAPDNVITSVTLDFDGTYDQIGTLYADGKLEPKIYPMNVENGGIKLVTPFKNVDPAVEQKVQQTYDDIKSGKLKVDPTAQVKP
jgi:basic membrane protein A and related proteins